MILEQVTAPQKRMISKEELLSEVEALPVGGILVTAGAGDIDRFCAPVAEVVKRKNRNGSH